MDQLLYKVLLGMIVILPLYGPPWQRGHSPIYKPLLGSNFMLFFGGR